MKIDICMMDVQRQEGTLDCRLFAVAFTALANGIKPGKLKFKQDSCAILKALYHAIRLNDFLMFHTSVDR